ncbi:MAG: 4Fe-4S binding protein [Anaerovoracaceae bacterium]|jgi:ech hydrogenase subunit D
MSEKKFMIQDFRDVANGELLSTVRNMKADGYRLGQICATTKPEGFELLYSFDKDHVLANLRVRIGREDSVESVTGEYWHAFIYENEMHDLFGISFLHNALDYGGNFFKTAQPTPWLDAASGKVKVKKSDAAPAEAAGGLQCSRDNCVYCGLCAKECPADAITVDRKAKTWAVDKDACLECGACVEKCPKKCLTLES